MTLFTWDHNDCTPPETRAQVADNMAFAPLQTEIAFFTFGGFFAEETLLDCTTYYWRVRGEDGAASGSWSPVWSFETDFEGACAAPPSPTPPEDGGGDGEPSAFAEQNLNCRAGDSTQFDVTGFFLEGETTLITGRNQSGEWLLLPKKTGGGDCWVATGLVTLSPENALELLKIYQSPPTPTPAPTATPTPAPSGGGFKVTNVIAVVSPPDYKGTCPTVFNFTARITTDGPGTVEYKWTRSDGATAPTQTLVFSAAGTQSVGDTWTLGGSGFSYSGWEAVEILAPNSLTSNQAAFNLSCDK
jgi:hypothetical protein